MATRVLFANLMIGRNHLTQKKHPLKMEFKYILFCRLPFCRLVHFMCETECKESALHQSKRNCFLSYSDHFLISWLTIMQIFGYKISSHYTVSAGKISLEMGTFWLGIDLWLLFCSSAHTCRIFHSTPLYTSSYMQHNFYSRHDFFYNSPYLSQLFLSVEICVAIHHSLRKLVAFVLSWWPSSFPFLFV